MRLTRSILAIVALTVSCAWAQTTPPAASTAPAKLQPTADQRKLMEANNNARPDMPAPRMDTELGVVGKPNPNFGKNYTWFQNRHESFLKRAKEPMGLLFLGDSITEGWNGNGKAVFEKEYGKYQAANFGIGGDRTQHVLWRIANGELDGIQPNPKVVVIMIGTNNSYTNTEEPIAAGIKKIVDEVHAKLPDSKVLLLSIFPRQADPNLDKFGKTSAIRAKLQKINSIIKKLDDGNKTRYLEIWNQFLTEDGKIPADIMPDALHPNAKGYQIWADAMRPTLEEMMK